MAELPEWNAAVFGCLTRDSCSVESLMRTAVTASLPTPWVSRKADTSAPLLLAFGINVTDAALAAWMQWVTYDLADGVLSFTLELPWGTLLPTVRARLMGAWRADRDGVRWQVSGQMELERWTLPRFSGGAYA